MNILNINIEENVKKMKAKNCVVSEYIETDFAFTEAYACEKMDFSWYSADSLVKQLNKKDEDVVLKTEKVNVSKAKKMVTSQGKEFWLTR